MSSINQSLSVVFFGNEQLSTGITESKTPSFEALLSSNHRVKALVMSKRGKSTSKDIQSIEKTAKDHEIPVIYSEKIDNNIEEIRKLDADIGVLAAFGQLLPAELLAMFPKGIINIHPSLLPQYRGPTPVEQAILDNAKNTGVSIIQLSEAMDAGPIFAQKSVEIPEHINSPELAKLLADVAAPVLLKVLSDIAANTAKPWVQDEAKATFCTLISKADGQINWKKSAHQLDSEIRAYAGWPGSQTVLAGKDVIITEVSIGKSQGNPGKTFMSHNGELGVYAGKDSLTIKQIKPVGKREMTGAEFARGYLK